MTHIPDESDLRAVIEELERGGTTDPGDVRQLVNEIRRARGKPTPDEAMGNIAVTGTLWALLGDPRVRELFPTLGRVIGISGEPALDFELSFAKGTYRLTVTRVPEEQ
jgi:hypothetical protein